MKAIFNSIKIFLFLTVLTGIVYPFFITGVAQILFPRKANGSLIQNGGRFIGSELIGQTFDSAIYFTPRPSAISYNPMPSGGSNLGLTSEKLKKQVEERKLSFREFNALDSLTVIPSEMLFASGSGLDPHISPEAAKLQIDRIAGARNFNSDQKEELKKCIDKLTEHPQLLCLGQERVNVLLLNLETDKIK
jgi:potassium-transporting ATPase KdpC subunit